MPAIEAVILDSSALLELLTNGRKANDIEKIWNDETISIEIPSVVLAELSSVLRRQDIESATLREKIAANCTVLDLTKEIALKAGELHAELRKKSKTISLADCIIMTHADNEGAVIVTKDPHFELYKNSRIL